MANRNALITGGAKGLGRKVAYQLASEGINLVINYRSSEAEAAALAKELTEKFETRNHIISGDITDYSECKKMGNEIKSLFETLDIIIHNAGPYVHERKRMTDYSAKEWHYLINGNLNAVFYLSSEFIPMMRKEKWGRIITIGFDRVETAPGWIYRSAFAAAKSGLASLTKTIALEEAENGVTANMVCPGDIIGEWKELDIAEAAGIIDMNVPVGRPGTGEDIARVISFLVDEKSSYITGAIIPVTGGKDVLGKVLRKDI